MRIGFCDVRRQIRVGHEERPADAAAVEAVLALCGPWPTFDMASRAQPPHDRCQRVSPSQGATILT